MRRTTLFSFVKFSVEDVVDDVDAEEGKGAFRSASGGSERGAGVGQTCARRRGTARAAAARARCREVSREAGWGSRKKHGSGGGCPESRPPSTAERGEGRA
jgi:hypothetical protein